MRRHQHNGQIGQFVAQPVDQLHPRDAGHAQVSEHAVEILFERRREPVLTVGITHHLVTLSGKDALQRRARRRVIINQTDAIRHTHAGGVWRVGKSKGKRTEKRVPARGADWKVISPPCCSTSLATIESPSPVPAAFVVKNGSNSRA